MVPFGTVLYTSIFVLVSMRRIFAILGALLSGAIGLAVFVPSAVEAGMKFN